MSTWPDWQTTGRRLWGPVLLGGPGPGTLRTDASMPLSAQQATYHLIRTEARPNWAPVILLYNRLDRYKRWNVGLWHSIIHLGFCPEKDYAFQPLPNQNPSYQKKKKVHFSFFIKRRKIVAPNNAIVNVRKIKTILFLRCRILSLYFNPLDIGLLV